MTSTTATRVLMSGMRYGIASLVSCALIAPASAQTTQPATQQPATRTVGSQAIVDSGEVARNPAKHYGETVMIQPDDVDRVVNRHVFLLDEDAAFAGPDILVLVPSPTGTPSQGDDVTVTGTVRPYVATDIERDYDWFDADGIEIDFKDRPVIVATSVKASDGRELAGVIKEVPVGRTAAQPQAGILEAGELAENPEQYVGKRVTVRAEVEEVYNPQLFTLDEDRMFVGPDVIVFARDGRTTMTEQADDEDMVVTVTGEVRKFIETDLFGSATWFDPWFNDLDEEGRGLVRSRPVIIADSVTSEAGATLYTANTTKPAATGAETAVGTSGQSSEAASSASSSSAPAKLEAGKSVNATGTVRTMANDGAFWIAMDGAAHPVLVIVDPAQASNFKPGANQRVIVTGTVKPSPGPDRVYIHAITIGPADR